MENKKEELKGLLKEVMAETIDNKELEVIKTRQAEIEEKNAKLLESNIELKAKFDSLQDRVITMKQNTGNNQYIFKGYDVTRPTKNFQIACSKEHGDEVASMLIKALTSGNTGAYAVPVEYSNALLGLAELSSVALSKCRIITTDTTIIKMPTKGTRATVDAQAFGTANTAAGTALGQLTFTIDKRIGAYEEVYNDILADSNFDVVGQIVEPMMAEAIGQRIDNEMLYGAEFTTDLLDATVAVTTNGVGATASGITFDNLNTIYYNLEWERGLVGEWFMSRPTMGAVAKLTDTNGRPIFQQVPINGKPSQVLMGAEVNIMSTIADAPADGRFRLAFGDPRQYIIAIRNGMIFQVNPYVSMREGISQFIMYARADGNLVTAGAFQLLKRVDS